MAVRPKFLQSLMHRRRVSRLFLSHFLFLIQVFNASGCICNHRRCFFYRTSEATLMPLAATTTTVQLRNMLERLVRRNAILDNLPALSILVGTSLGDYMLLSMARLCASPHSTLYHYHLPSACRLLIAHRSSLLSHISSIFDMSQPSSLSSNFRILFDAALQDYKDKTGNTLTDHPIAKQLETCESIASITAILQGQAQCFREFRENDGKLMKALNSSVDVLCSPSISSALSETIGLVVRRKVFIRVRYS